jgi:hypothetical protein
MESTVSPSHILPSHILRIISEYSKPLTRPDWRESKPIISVQQLYFSVYTSWDEDDLHHLIYRNIKKTYWYDVYWYIKLSGPYLCCKFYNITLNDIINMGIIID